MQKRNNFFGTGYSTAIWLLLRRTLVQSIYTVQQYALIYQSMKKHTALLLLCVISILSGACNKKMYYKKVSDNIGDFDLVIKYVQQRRLLIPNDSLILKYNSTLYWNQMKCIYNSSLQDSTLAIFMKKFDLDRICFTQDKKPYFDSVITFHKNYAPFFGKAITVRYDFGRSGFRDSITLGSVFKDGSSKVINELFLYSLNSKPVFGE